MKLAVLSDVHGNLPALEAVLEDIERRNIRRIAFLGDLALLGLYPQECFDLLARYEPQVWIKGNADDDLHCLRDPLPATDFGQWLKSIADYAITRMSRKSIALIDGLPICETLPIEESEITFCHGSPYDIAEKLDDTLTQETQRKIETDGLRHILCGHTHKEKNFRIGSCDITNFGAVGYSFDGDIGAKYGIIETMDDGDLKCENVTLKYDSAEYIERVERENPPFQRTLLHALKHGLPRSFKQQ